MPNEHSMSVSGVCDVVEFGASSDGRAVSTQAIQKAIDTAAQFGGGTVVFPPGVFVSGTLFLRSGVTLELHDGAVLRGSPQISDYTPFGEHLGDRQLFHLLVADHVEHVTICGGGIIDGNGPAFWERSKGPRTWIGAKPVRVSPLLEISHCRDVRLYDVTIRQSPGWTLHLHNCDRVWVRGVELVNHLFGPNTDGFDINGCRDVFVSDCTLECGDDAIVLKATDRSCERVLVTNCALRSHCAAFKLGTESRHDFRHVTFSNSAVYGSNRGIGIYNFDGCLMEHIACSNITIDTDCGFALDRPIHIDVRTRGEQASPPAQVSSPPVKAGIVRDVSISHISARTDGRILVTAADGGEIDNLRLVDVSLRYPRLDDPTERGKHSRSAQFSNHSPAARCAAAAVVLENVRGLLMRDVRAIWPQGEPTAPTAQNYALAGEEDFSGWGTDTALVENGPPVDALSSEQPAAPVRFHFVWARGVQGVLDCPLATSSDPELPLCDINDSRLLVR